LLRQLIVVEHRLNAIVCVRSRQHKPAVTANPVRRPVGPCHRGNEAVELGYVGIADQMPQVAVPAFEVGNVEAAEEAREAQRRLVLEQRASLDLFHTRADLLWDAGLASVGLRRDNEARAVPIRDENIMKQHGVPSIRARHKYGIQFGSSSNIIAMREVERDNEDAQGN
jgi:hypothetical protein